MNQTATELRIQVQKLRDLPPLSTASGHLLTALTDQDIGLDEVARAISLDPGLSARIIGLARSAYFGNPGPIYTVEEAIIRVLGLNLVKSLALSTALGAGFNTHGCPGADLRRYWLTAMLTSSLARRLRGFMPADAEGDVDAAYLGGLLHNLGLLALIHIEPQAMSKVFAVTAADPARRTWEVSREQFDVDHHEVGGWLGRRWHLPSDVVTVMEHHHEPYYRGPSWRLATLVGLCSRRAQELILEERTESDEPELREQLGLGDEAYAAAVADWVAQKAESEELAVILADS